ncbi:hypothetical protein [Saccharothrix saharensis]|uniref:hypothetical protein n=1 Tax=Saccharothrix saharensis TaxID=571190 RepID=UPI00115227FD|nr:hypothetical protein [Saccharothrix saharensis]
MGRYLDLVEAEMRRDPEMREGQAHYVALCRGWPHLHEQIAGTERDCFSVDRRLPAFLAWVEEALAAEQRAAGGSEADDRPRAPTPPLAQPNGGATVR